MKVTGVSEEKYNFSIELTRDDIALMAHGLYQFESRPPEKTGIGERRLKAAKLLRAGLLEVLHRYES